MTVGEAVPSAPGQEPVGISPSATVASVSPTTVPHTGQLSRPTPVRVGSLTETSQRCPCGQVRTLDIE